MPFVPLPSRGRISAALPALAAVALLACGGKSPETGGESQPAPAHSPAPAPSAPAVPMPGPATSAPLPAPGEQGLSARHGGLVEISGPIGLELVATATGARVYLYESSGAPLAAAEASGTLTASAGGKTATLALKLTSEDGAAVLSGEGPLPPAFEGKLDLKVGAETHSVAIRWGAGGVPGSSRTEPPGSGTPPAAAVAP